MGGDADQGRRVKCIRFLPKKWSEKCFILEYCRVHPGAPMTSMIYWSKAHLIKNGCFGEKWKEQCRKIHLCTNMTIMCVLGFLPLRWQFLEKGTVKRRMNIFAISEMGNA
mmetsp:Transcript_22338/g.48075  ORF Transcript_22338/g.48075 Transcript_22338/m.48075 type:complete len:110 (-) Transcript_22338:10-339(-)